MKTKDQIHEDILTDLTLNMALEMIKQNCPDETEMLVFGTLGEFKKQMKLKPKDIKAIKEMKL
tara:strand:+ start:361 stop:549 length:189 start_codon:yes stop_codon:yes gene_type:complete